MNPAVIQLLANLTSLALTATQAARHVQEGLALVGGILTRMQAEGRTTLTPEEWAQIDGADATARARLQALIDQGQAGG